MVVSACSHGRGEGKSCRGEVHEPAMYSPHLTYIYWASNPGHTDLLQPEPFLLSVIYASPPPLVTESLSVLLAFSKSHFRFYWPAPILSYISSIFATIVLRVLPCFSFIYFVGFFSSFLSGKLICLTWKFFSFITFNPFKHAPAQRGCFHCRLILVDILMTSII